MNLLESRLPQRQRERNLKPYSFEVPGGKKMKPSYRRSEKYNCICLLGYKCSFEAGLIVDSHGTEFALYYCDKHHGQNQNGGEKKVYLACMP